MSICHEWSVVEFRQLRGRQHYSSQIIASGSEEIMRRFFKSRKPRAKSELSLVNLDGKTVERNNMIPKIHKVYTYFFATSERFPDGHALAYLTWQGNGANLKLYHIEAVTGLKAKQEAIKRRVTDEKTLVMKNYKPL